MVHHTN